MGGSKQAIRASSGLLQPNPPDTKGETMPMSKKHYEQFAALVRSYEAGSVGVVKLASDLADIFTADSPRFDRDAFMAASLSRSADTAVRAIRESIAAGQHKIGAIKRYREYIAERTGVKPTLLDARDAIESNWPSSIVRA